MAATAQGPLASAPCSFYHLPVDLRHRIYNQVMPRSKSLSSPTLLSQPTPTAKALSHTSRLVRQESMKLYYGRYTFWHLVVSFREFGSADDAIYNNDYMQKWLNAWGALVFENIRSLEIDVSERRRGESYTHKMHIDLNNIDNPVTTEFSYWGPRVSHWAIQVSYWGPRLSFWNTRVTYQSSKPDDNLADINAFVHALLVVGSPEESKLVFTPERFKTLLKGLWYSYACVGDSIAPRKRMFSLETLKTRAMSLWNSYGGVDELKAPSQVTVISKLSMAHGFAAKDAKEQQLVIAGLLAGDIENEFGGGQAETTTEVETVTETGIETETKAEAETEAEIEIGSE